MKTKFAIAALALALSSSAAFADHSESYGTITFTGAVSAVSCNIDIDGTNNKNATINLPVAYKTDLRDGQAVKTKDFSIAFSGCSVVDTAGGSATALNDGTVSVTWDESTQLAPGVESKGYLYNTLNADAAGEVYLALFNKGDSSNAIVPGADSAKKTATIENGNAVFNYTVGYITDDASSVTPGKINSEAVYMVTYN